MNKLLQLLTVIIIVASGLGGIITGIYPILGTCLVILGIAWQAFTHISTERRSQFFEQVIEAQNKLLAQAGMGNPYTEIVKNEFRKKGYFKAAISYLRKALDDNPYDLEALIHYVSIISLTFSMRQWIKGIKYGHQNKEWLYVYEVAKRGHKKYPDNFVFPAALGILLDLAEEHKLAQQMFRKSGALRNDPYWHVHLATSYGMSGHLDLAMKELESAINEGVHGWVIEYHTAGIQRDLGNYDQALDYVRKAFRLGGKIPQIRKIEEECLFADGRLVSSAWSKIKLACQLVLLNPKRSFKLLFAACGHFVIMIIVFLSKKIWPITSHIPMVNKFQYKHFPPIEPEFTVGCELVRKGHFGKATKLFERCRKVNPRDVAVLMNLAGCHAHTENVDEAIRIIDEALLIDPRNDALKHNREQYLSGVKLKGIFS